MSTFSSSGIIYPNNKVCSLGQFSILYCLFQNKAWSSGMGRKPLTQCGCPTSWVTFGDAGASRRKKREKRKKKTKRERKREKQWNRDKEKKERKEMKEWKERCPHDILKMLLTEMLKTLDIMAGMLKIWKSWCLRTSSSTLTL